MRTITRSSVKIADLCNQRCLFRELPRLRGTIPERRCRVRRARAEDSAMTNTSDTGNEPA